MSESGDLESRTKLAYDEALRGLAIQERSLEAYRRLAALMLTVTLALAAVVNTASPTANSGWIFAATAAVSAVGCAAFILWPREWLGSHDVDRLLVDWVDDPDEVDGPSHERSLTAMYRSLAESAISYRSKNSERLKGQETALIWGWASVLIEFVGLMIVRG